MDMLVESSCAPRKTITCVGEGEHFSSFMINPVGEKVGYNLENVLYLHPILVKY